MKKFTAIEMRKEMIELSEATKKLESVNEQQEITEKFLKASDPTVAVGVFIDEIDKVLSSIKSQYDSNAKDRNKIAKPVQDAMGKMNALIGNLGAAFGRSAKNPEDNNKSV